MKRILVFVAPILILAVAFGCSSDHEAPTKGVYSGLAVPNNVTAEYDSLNDLVAVSWDITDTDGVVGYLVAVADSAKFNVGDVEGFKTNADARSFDYLASELIPADQDSLIKYFSVSVILNNDTFDYFVGPQSEVVSETILRK